MPLEQNRRSVKPRAGFQPQETCVDCVDNIPFRNDGRHCPCQCHRHDGLTICPLCEGAHKVYSNQWVCSGCGKSIFEGPGFWIHSSGNGKLCASSIPTTMGIREKALHLRKYQQERI